MEGPRSPGIPTLCKRHTEKKNNLPGTFQVPVPSSPTRFLLGLAVKVQIRGRRQHPVKDVGPRAEVRDDDRQKGVAWWGWSREKQRC